MRKSLIVGTLALTLGSAQAQASEPYRQWDAAPLFTQALGTQCLGALEFEDMSALAICGGMVYAYDPNDGSVTLKPEYPQGMRIRLQADIVRDADA